MSQWSQSGGRSGRIKKVEDVKLVDQLVEELSQGNLSVRNIKEEEIDHKQCELHVSPRTQSQGLTSRRVTFASSTQTGKGPSPQLGRALGTNCAHTDALK